MPGLLSKLLSTSISSFSGFAAKAIAATPKTIGEGIWGAVRKGSSEMNAAIAGKSTMTWGEAFRGTYAGRVQGVANQFASMVGSSARSIGRTAGVSIPGSRIAMKVARPVRDVAVKALTKGWEKFPMGKAVVAGSLGAGFVFGAGSAALQRADMRTQMQQGRGMSGNNLSTDGLTLALSKRRHR